MTGLSPSVHGVRKYPNPGRMSERVETLAEVLQRSGLRDRRTHRGRLRARGVRTGTGLRLLPREFRFQALSSSTAHSTEIDSRSRSIRHRIGSGPRETAASSCSFTPTDRTFLGTPPRLRSGAGDRSSTRTRNTPSIEQRWNAGTPARSPRPPTGCSWRVTCTTATSRPATPRSGLNYSRSYSTRNRDCHRRAALAARSSLRSYRS